MSVARVSFAVLAIISQVNMKSLSNNDTAAAELEEYIASEKNKINPRYRPHYHVAPPVGWMNDPNGFSYINGVYHLFYQFYPYDSVWGPMHWGHVVSNDLANWKQLPTALMPGEEQCFSGSAVSDGEKMILMYTGHRITEDDPFYNQTQYLAFSDDGINFYKYKGNPVLASSPNSSPDFRDPKVWKHDDHWYVIIGSKTDDNRGRVLLYRSTDMMNWEFLNVLGESNGEMGYMWECPDFFELDGKFVLLMSPQGLKPQGDRYKNVYQTGYYIGHFDYTTFEFLPETDFQEMDYGHDFYAAQTAEADGKRYVIAWFNMWEVPHPEDVDGWAGAMTIAREIKLVNNRIHMKPVDGLISLRDGVVFEGGLQNNEGETFDKAVEISIRSNLSKKIELELSGLEGGGKVWLRWDPEGKKVVVDRGSNDIRQVEWNPVGSHRWRIYLDASSLELFCGEGEVVFSSRVFPIGDWKLLNLSPQTLDVVAFLLKRSVPE